MTTLNLSLFCPETRELMLPSGETKSVPDVVVQDALKSGATETVRSWAIRKGIIGLDGFVGMFDMPMTPTPSRAAPQLQLAAVA